jgi:hypothetical protein
MISVTENLEHQLAAWAAWVRSEEAHVTMRGWKFVDEIEITQNRDGSYTVRVIEPDVEIEPVEPEPLSASLTKGRRSKAPKEEPVSEEPAE